MLCCFTKFNFSLRTLLTSLKKFFANDSLWCKRALTEIQLKQQDIRGIIENNLILLICNYFDPNRFLDLPSFMKRFFQKDLSFFPHYCLREKLFKERSQQAARTQYASSKSKCLQHPLQFRRSHGCDFGQIFAGQIFFVS